MAKRKAPAKPSRGQMVFAKGKGKKLKMEKSKQPAVFYKPKSADYTPKPALLQDHVNPKPNPHLTSAKPPKIHSEKKATVKASQGKVGTNPALKKTQRNVRYNNTVGLGGPERERMLSSIKRRIPIAVTDRRQVIMPTRNNAIPMTGKDPAMHTLPMQQLVAARGGYGSGRVRDL